MGLEQGTLLWWTLLVVFSAAGITLLAWGILATVSATSRFRILACASFVGYFILSLVLGCGYGLAVWCLTLWVLAIVGNALNLRVTVDT
ncbi:MAG: hypothetical protein ACI9G1_005493 [Pirellulaceae bacterium]|jgi:hypothetical protein